MTKKFLLMILRTLDCMRALSPICSFYCNNSYNPYLSEKTTGIMLLYKNLEVGFYEFVLRQRSRLCAFHKMAFAVMGTIANCLRGIWFNRKDCSESGANKIPSIEKFRKWNEECIRENICNNPVLCLT